MTAKYSHRDLILFFRHQLRTKIRCEKNTWTAKYLTEGGCMQQDLSYKRGQYWNHLSLLFLHRGNYRSGSSGPYPSVNKIACLPNSIISSMLWVIIPVIWMLACKLVSYLLGFYGISTFGGYLMPNPFYTNNQFYFKRFSLAWVHSLIIKNFSISSYSV